MVRTQKFRWLSRNVLVIGVVSFLSDLGHETATTILPAFLAAIGAAPWALGIIEGVSDALASFSKLWSGWYCDRSGKHKSVATSGYFLTGFFKGALALATSWWHVLFMRTVAWLGRGMRSPARDRILADSTEPAHYGKAFGFDRALDTAGAIVGPMVAMLLVGVFSHREIFAFTLLPGLAAAFLFMFGVRARKFSPNPSLKFSIRLTQFPKPYRRFLIAVALFGLGDFAHTLLILRATQIFSEQYSAAKAAQLAMSLYVIHNIVYAAASIPVGALGDRWHKRKLLAIGYGLAVLMNIGFLFSPANYIFLAGLFILGGLFIAVEDALEKAIAAEMVPEEIQATGFGVLATLNGLGDFVSSTVVSLLWTAVSPQAGFGFAALVCFSGAVMMWRLPAKDSARAEG